MEQLFDSIYQAQTSQVDPKAFFLSLLTSLVLGVCLAQAYKQKTLYTREFVTLLSILPTLISVLIFLVNGNLGTSVAVAGTFSLVRFRSAAGGARELMVLFIAMGIGLAIGSGYLALATLFTALLLGIVWLLEVTGFSRTHQLRRQILVTIPSSFDYEVLLEVILAQTCQFVELSSIKSKAKKQTLTLEYLVDLKPTVTDKQVIQDLLSHREGIEVSISRMAGKKKSL